MKVLVFGASGFIAFPSAQAFSRAGHIVYGVTRSQNTADKLLAPEEIIPVVCDFSTREGRDLWSPIAASCDVVIDSVPATGPEVPLGTYHHVLSLVKARDPGARLTYIYTGGSWVHSRGTGGLETWTDERQPHSGQNKLTAWRWEVEKEVLSSTSSQDPNSRADESGDEVNGIVVRPPVLYGRSGSLLKGLVFQPALEAAKKGESFETFANPDTRFLTIHQDDLADLFVRVAERAPICKGQAFVGANPLSERFGDVLDAVVRVSGAKGHKIRAPDQKNAFEIAWTSTTNLKPSLVTALTGWTPKKMGLVDGMDVYWSSFLASLNQG